MSAPLREGYKQTEVGVIPEDWESGTIKSLAASVSNAIVGGPFGSDLVSRDYVDDGVPVIRGQNMGRRWLKGPYVFVTDKKAASLEANLARPGDVLFTQRGTLGQVSIVPDIPFRRYLVSQSQMKVTLNSKIADSKFLLCWFVSERGQETIRLNTIQTGVPHINLGILRGLTVPIPPIREQEAIAEALNDVDALIESLEQLIIKKRHLKQGTMQELLTGKKRLPGFSSKWEVKLLDTISEIRSGGTPSTNQAEFWDGNVLWCTPTDITALKGFKYLTHTSRTISDRGLKCSSAELIPAGSILMTSRATIGECAINVVPVATNQGFKNFTPFQNTDGDFLYYLLQTKKQEFISLCGGSTFLEIGKNKLASFEIELPKEKSEQTAIATVLSDMDTGIAELEAQLAKTRTLKQGMMNELLTGKIRLK
ncbi:MULTISPECIES: restriction endonuclease subunit S [unclassified Janthinobacterium]|uniref:restriction endonuclease subunit S n=1 Tax=unclassified Janthinobacterium TaxID=2610881 RepID=UPI00161B3E1C|nr:MULTISPECIES: restriction endonuclease subunit S [unclassified Janthinobacterium]MBB5607983.1 type I restriction enzyme S subunit [Janthinobacterium sp. S3T4]MBB5613276.1 type I restriction enzyme S subunit [Janthinobacterium sp. S3M3]